MDVHQNARTTRHGRLLMIHRLADGWSMAAVAAAFGVDAKTVRKWRDRHAKEGEAGLADRSSRPHHSPTRLSERRRGRDRGAAPPAPVRPGDRPPARPARRHRGRRPAPTRARPAQAPSTPSPRSIRYQREQPGELIHIDIKKLGRIDGIGHRITGDRRGQKRGIGWDFLHVCVDDASRLAYTEILPDERKESAVAFLERAIAWFATPRRHGRAGDDRQRLSLSQPRLPNRLRKPPACKHKRTKPYTPQTNGKAERFIQTSLREWAYLQAFDSSAARTQAMRPWLHRYNTKRPHSALAGKPPLTKLNRDNLHSNDS